jgi:hypothetical protein
MKCTLETFIVSRCGLLRRLHQGTATIAGAEARGLLCQGPVLLLALAAPIGVVGWGGRWSKSIRMGAQSRRQGQLGEQRSRSSRAGDRSNGRDGRERSIGLVRMPRKRSHDGTDALHKAFRIKETRHTVLRCMLLCQVGFSRDDRIYIPFAGSCETH